MPNPSTKKRAEQDRAEGKSGSTQAGEFVREEMHHIREGKHGARNTKQAIAIGLSKARRAGFGKREPHAAASPTSLSRHAKASAERPRKAGGADSPSAAAKRAAKTRKRRASARKAA